MLRDSIDVADLIGILVLIGAIIVLLFMVRRAAIRRGAASLECSLNLGAGRGWRMGLARYTDDDLQWFRLFSLAARPSLTASRPGIRIVSRRAPRRLEAVTVTAGAVIFECNLAGPDGTSRVVEFAMSSSGAMGFLAWVESSPPGTHTHPDARRA
jgi:hypothetical protein